MLWGATSAARIGRPWNEEPPRTEDKRMAGRFRQIFWGLIIVVLDIPEQFDVLLDGVGYVLVALGAGGLREYSRHFGTTKVLALVLAAIWLLGFARLGGAAVPYMWVVAVGDCAMMWMLLGGIMDYTRAREHIDLALRASKLRIAFIMAFAALTVIGAEGPVGIALVIILLVVVAMILRLIFRVRREVTEQETGLPRASAEA